MGEAEDLNYDCNYNMFLTKAMLGNLTSLDGRNLSEYNSHAFIKISDF